MPDTPNRRALYMRTYRARDRKKYEAGLARVQLQRRALTILGHRHPRELAAIIEALKGR